MAVVPTFQPGGAPGQAVDSYIEGRNAGESWMAQAQRRKLLERQQVLEEQQAAQRTALMQVTMPLQVAKVRAGVAEADNAYAADLQMQDLMVQANTEMPNIRSAWKKTYLEPDQAKRLMQQDEILSNAARFSSLKGVGEEVSAWQNIYAKAQIDKRTQDMITGRSEVAALQAQAMADRAALTQQHQKELENVRAQNRVVLEDKKAANALRTTGGKVRSAAAVKANEEMLTLARDSAFAAQDAERGLALLDNPDTRTGTGAVFENNIRRMGQLIGFDSAEVKNVEQLQEILGNAVLRRVNQTKGAISDKEMELFTQYSASPQKSIEGNKAILEAYAKARRREVEIGKMINDMRQDGVSETDIQNEINDFVLETPIFDSGELAVLRGTGGGSKPNAPATGAATSAKDIFEAAMKRAKEGK